MKTAEKQKVLYLVVCAAPPASRIGELVTLAQLSSWDVCIIATPQATKFIDQDCLEQLTGHPVRSDYKLPTDADVLPTPDAIIVMPATFNTINKWALGIGDTLAVSILCEAIGKEIPITAVAYLNDELRKHPSYLSHVQLLKASGVHVIYKNDLPKEQTLEHILVEFERSRAGKMNNHNKPPSILDLTRTTIQAFLDGYRQK